MTAAPDGPTTEPAGSAERLRWANLALRVAGTVVGLLLAFATALWEIFLSPLYAGSVPLPVSPVLAVLTSLGLVWFTRVVTGHNGLALLPGVVWFATMVIAANRTHAGDLLLPGNDYMGLAAILLGCAAWGLAGYRMILAGRPAGPLTARASTSTTAPASAGRPAAIRAAPGPKPGAKPVSAGRAQGRRRPSGPSGRQP